MLELQAKPQFNVVVPPKLLQEGYLVHFPMSWPSTYKAVSGKTFRLDATSQVPYDLSYIIPTGDYRDVDFSNGSGTFQEGIMPENLLSLFEVSLGFKPGAFIAEFFIPAGKALHRLEYAQMEPDITNAKRLFLGAYTAKASPYEDPRIKMYFIKDFTALIMRLYVLAGVDYEKVVAGLIVNRCRLREIPSPTQDDMRKAKVIRYYDELRW
ncbi:hypothetical protein LCGC14_1481940 [marine sediment metagenome]|uniref:Uncharacterized protein n=1 Tax=marine sediment metagenome TaxID=412755 RepID=A0A0F9J9B7_9ZZZZ